MRLGKVPMKALLHPYLHCKHSAALVAECVPILHSPWWYYFTVWLAQQSFTVGLHSASFPSLYTSWQLGLVIVLHACSHLSSLICICQLFFHSFIFNGFHYQYCYYYFSSFDQLPLNVFWCDWCSCFVVFFCFVYPLVWGGGIS